MIGLVMMRVMKSCNDDYDGDDGVGNDDDDG